MQVLLYNLWNGQEGDAIRKFPIIVQLLTYLPPAQVLKFLRTATSGLQQGQNVLCRHPIHDIRDGHGPSSHSLERQQDRDINRFDGSQQHGCHF